jgi:AraC family L-rhamnose operon transcriptional activator RhaR
MIFCLRQQAVAVADRYPQNVFAEHTHEFCELVLVWRGNGLHVLNDRPYRITRGDLFYIRAEDKHSYASVNDLVCRTSSTARTAQLNVDWAAYSRLQRCERLAALAFKQHGMGQVRQVISQLEQESRRPIRWLTRWRNAFRPAGDDA